MVEKVLIENGHAKTAKAYIIYRKQRSDLREITDTLAGFESIVEDYLGGEDWRINENSNTTYALQGLNNYISSTVTAKYWLNKIYLWRSKKLIPKGGNFTYMTLDCSLFIVAAGI